MVFELFAAKLVQNYKKYLDYRLYLNQKIQKYAFYLRMCIFCCTFAPEIVAKQPP